MAAAPSHAEQNPGVWFGWARIGFLRKLFLPYAGRARFKPPLVAAGARALAEHVAQLWLEHDQTAVQQPRRLLEEGVAVLADARLALDAPSGERRPPRRARVAEDVAAAAAVVPADEK